MDVVFNPRYYLALSNVIIYWINDLPEKLSTQDSFMVSIVCSWLVKAMLASSGDVPGIEISNCLRITRGNDLKPRGKRGGKDLKL
ncbi:hypothetical protein V6N13_090565 [Hibiscus sabdariffa]